MPLTTTNPYLELHAEIRRGPGRGASSAQEMFAARELLCRRYAWAIPDDEAIAALVRLSPIVEIGAGTGYWAALVAAAGGDVVAYDIEPREPCWSTVITGTPSAAGGHDDRTMLLCWPPYADPMAADALDAYSGDRVVYVGEGRGGCTADDRFFDILEREYHKERTVNIPAWDFVHDVMSIWYRR